MPHPQPSFEEELLPHRARVRQLALGLTGGDADDADDLVQETYVRALRSWHTYDPRGHPFAWLRAICRSVHWKRTARSRRENEILQRAWGKGALGPDGRSRGTHSDPGRDLLRSGRRQSCRDALDEVPDVFRRALELRYLQDFTYREIAGRLEVPIGTVRSRLHRGREVLKEILTEGASPTADSGNRPTALAGT